MAHLLEPFLRVQYSSTVYAHAYTMKHTVGVAVWRGLAVGQMEPWNLFNENFVDSYLWNLGAIRYSLLVELLSSYILIQFELLEVAGLLLLFCLRESCHATGGRITLETCIAHAAFCVCLFYYPSLTNLPFVVTSKGWPPMCCILTTVFPFLQVDRSHTQVLNQGKVTTPCQTVIH